MVEKTQAIKDFLLAKDSEIIRAKLEGHKDTVNSLDILKPIGGGGEPYLSKYDTGLLLSASDDGKMNLWDMRIDKRVVMIDGGTEVVKAKFINE